ncbi:MAG: metal ABC transporter ATP-binding protein [Rubrobacteraceae bacterium]
MKTAKENSYLAEVSGLSAGYGAHPVLRDIGFRVEPGSRIGVLGPNGGGKTTLFRVLLGELAPLEGSVTVRTRCGVVPQTERSRLDYPVSALDVALMGTLGRVSWWRRPGRDERRRALGALDEVGLRDLADRQFGELSGGQRQRVLVARALVQDARLLLLDEPFSGLDGPSSERLGSLLGRLSSEGRGLMISTHDIEQVRGWDMVLCLNQRQVAFGKPSETLTRPVIEATYGPQVVVIEGDGTREASAILPPQHHDRGR